MNFWFKKRMAHPLPTPKGNNTSSDVGAGSLLPPPMNQDAKRVSFKSRITSTERVNTIIASTASTVLKIIPPYGQRQHYFPQHPEVNTFDLQ